MSDTPAFLDSGRPPVPDLVVPRGVLPFYLPKRPVRGRLVRLGVLADMGLPDAVLSVILAETDLYADEQLGRIAREMGFAEELSAVLDRLER